MVVKKKSNWNNRYVLLSITWSIKTSYIQMSLSITIICMHVHDRVWGGNLQNIKLGFKIYWNIWKKQSLARTEQQITWIKYLWNPCIGHSYYVCPMLVRVSMDTLTRGILGVGHTSIHGMESGDTLTRGIHGFATLCKSR